MSSTKGILIVFHTSSNAGYAMTALEKMFFNVCSAITKDPSHVHFSFTDISSGRPKSLPEDFDRFIRLDHQDKGTFKCAKTYILKNNIKYVLCFDVQPRAKICSFLRSCGIEKIVSYWGSTISSINPPLKLFLKKLDVILARAKPDLFIFESEAMRELAIQGRGISAQRTTVIPTGVDTSKFEPTEESDIYVRNTFGIPPHAKIAFYSGHMEERKGVKVIIEAAIHLAKHRPELPIYFLICGNRPGEEIKFMTMLGNSPVRNKVIFGGYRNDLALIMPGCTVGIVASTGWDSFPMSTLEMAASGLPIVVSHLQGLVETLDEGNTGYTFEPGNSLALSEKITKIADDNELHERLSKNAISRINRSFTVQVQFDRLYNQLSSTFQ
ncbi:glycosyltransferase family 4 protein [Cellvibrio sp. NN19]|uniref:glycosyltransferase family 4 protein n=1 Tax=Cellvibrio chitinivorans TaxID=3102792 RepID=UPI002B40167A|nr:glycosyltransferase family 4 protein [Cellvibrio sp. NN19]